jgi:hypothetical protein
MIAVSTPVTILTPPIRRQIVDRFRLCDFVHRCEARPEHTRGSFLRAFERVLPRILREPRWIPRAIGDVMQRPREFADPDERVGFEQLKEDVEFYKSLDDGGVDLDTDSED